MNAFSLSDIYSDGMVFQRDKEILIAGKSTPGAEVFSEFCGKIVSANADENGDFLLCLPPESAGGPYLLSVTSGNEGVLFSDVYIGEVWLCGGQSNMERELKFVCDENEFAGFNDEKIRFYITPKIAMPDEPSSACWQTLTPESAHKMSAVAYFAAKILREKLDVPVGIIGAYWGGSSISCWISEKTLESIPEGRMYLDEFKTELGDKTDEQYEKEMAYEDEWFKNWLALNDKYRSEHPDADEVEVHRHCGDIHWPLPVGRKSAFRPAGMFDTMIKRIIPFAVRGVWWYQGEEDSKCPDRYAKMTAALQQDWRAYFGNIPFIATQIPMYINVLDYDKMGETFRFARIREQQQKALAITKNSYLVSGIDCGEFDNLHPKKKRPVGERIALCSLKYVYGFKDVDTSYPTISSCKFVGGHAEMTVEDSDGLRTVDGTPPKAFRLAGSDGVFYDAKAEIFGNTVIAVSDKVNNPMFVRYAFTDYTDVNVVGKNGLPLLPFRTDNF